jgi:nitrogen regulatory protein PII
MKMIIAMIQPHKLETVKQALTENQFIGVTVSDVQGFGRQKGRVELYRGAEYLYDYVPKVKLEIAVEANRVPLLVDVLSKAAKTGKIGDGKIFITNLKQVQRIRSGERGVEAL